jgi:hypothetical protein
MSRSYRQSPLVANGTGGMGGTGGRRLRLRQYRRSIRQAVQTGQEVLPDLREWEGRTSDMFCRAYKVWQRHSLDSHWKRK